MSKFKAGDRVRHKHAVDAFAGKVATVTLVSGGYVEARLDTGEEGMGVESVWELVEAAKPAIDAHYTKHAIQPMEFSLANGLDAAQHTVIKYTVRYRDKGGIRDLRAAIRVLELMIEREEKAQANG